MLWVEPFVLSCLWCAGLGLAGLGCHWLRRFCCCRRDARPRSRGSCAWARRWLRCSASRRPVLSHPVPVGPLHRRGFPQLLFRDYGRYDAAELRFRRGQHKLADHFYVRSDGTRAFYFALGMRPLLSLLPRAHSVWSNVGYLCCNAHLVSVPRRWCCIALLSPPILPYIHTRDGMILSDE